MGQSGQTFKDRVRLLAEKFTQDVVTALAGGSLSDLVAAGLTLEFSPGVHAVPYKPTAVMDRARTAKPRKTTKRSRRTASDIHKTAAEIILFVGKNPNSGAEAIRKALHIPKSGWLQPIAMALTAGLKKKGEKRSTVYYTGAAKVAKMAAKAAKGRSYKKLVKPSVLAAGDVTSTPLETTNGTSTQVDVHPVLTETAS
jgi:hypothetical protein